MAVGRDDYAPGVLAVQETDEVLAEVGRDTVEIARLRESGIVWSESVQLS